MSSFKVLYYETIDEKYLMTPPEKFDKWDVFNYLIKYKGKRRSSLYIPMWFYTYLEETTLENYQISLLKALSSDFRIYGVKEYPIAANELLVITY